MRIGVIEEKKLIDMIKKEMKLKTFHTNKLQPTAAFVLLGCDAKRRSTAVTLFSFLSQLDFYY